MILAGKQIFSPSPTERDICMTGPDGTVIRETISVDRLRVEYKRVVSKGEDDPEPTQISIVIDGQGPGDLNAVKDATRRISFVAPELATFACSMLDNVNM